jgi:hypothetical protein
MWNKNRTEIIYEAPHRDLIENLPDGGLPSAASGASSSSSNLATVNVISIFGGHGRNTQGKWSIMKLLFLIITIKILFTATIRRKRLNIFYTCKRFSWLRR